MTLVAFQRWPLVRMVLAVLVLRLVCSLTHAAEPRADEAEVYTLTIRLEGAEITKEEFERLRQHVHVTLRRNSSHSGSLGLLFRVSAGKVETSIPLAALDEREPRDIDVRLESRVDVPLQGAVRKPLTRADFAKDSTLVLDMTVRRRKRDSFWVKLVDSKTQLPVALQPIALMEFDPIRNQSSQVDTATTDDRGLLSFGGWEDTRYFLMLKSGGPIPVELGPIWQVPDNRKSDTAKPLTWAFAVPTLSIRGRMVVGAPHQGSRKSKSLDGRLFIAGGKGDVSRTVEVAKGAFEIRDLQPDTYKLSLDTDSIPDHAIMGGDTVVVSGRETAPIDQLVTLAPLKRAACVFRFTDDRKNPLPKVKLVVRRPGSMGRQYISDARGEVSLDAWETSHTMLAALPGYAGWSEDVAIEDGKEYAVELKPLPTTAIAVQDQKGQPLAEVTVVFFQRQAGLPPKQWATQTDKTGNARIVGLPQDKAVAVAISGKETLCAVAVDLRDTSRLTLTAQDRHDVTVTIRGTVDWEKPALIVMNRQLGVLMGMEPLADNRQCRFRLAAGTYDAYLRDGDRVYPVGQLTVTDDRPAKDHELHFTDRARELAKPIDDLMRSPQ